MEISTIHQSLRLCASNIVMTMLSATFMPTGVEALLMVIAGHGQLARLWRTCHLHIKILYIELTELRQVPLSFAIFYDKELIIPLNLTYNL